MPVALRSTHRRAVRRLAILAGGVLAALGYAIWREAGLPQQGSPIAYHRLTVRDGEVIG